MIHNFSGFVITERAVKRLHAAHSKAIQHFMVTGKYIIPVLEIQTMTKGRPSGNIWVKITQAGCVYPHNPV